MTPGALPPAALAVAAVPAGQRRFSGRLTVGDLPDGPAVFLVEMGSLPSARTAPPPVPGVSGGAPAGWGGGPLASIGLAGTLLRYSDRGWTGEPSDAAAPNVAYPPRLLEPPSIERGIRVLPEHEPGMSYQSGEMTLDNADGALDVVGGDWTLAGQPVVLRRGPHRRPRAAAFAECGAVAALRVTAAPMGADRLTVSMQDGATALNVPVSGVYAGTGGMEGDATLAGQSKPVLYGYKGNLQPVLLLTGDPVYQVSALPLYSVPFARDRGVPLTYAGDFPSLAALRAAALTAGQYATCLSSGLVRPASPPVGQFTVDATSAAGVTTHADVALALLRGPGGVGEAQLAAATFSAVLPGGQVGWLFTGGTVDDAVSAVMTSSGYASWGSDRLGRVCAIGLPNPSTTTPRLRIERWMLAASPEEEACTAPRWRQRIGYLALGTTQSATDLAGVAATPAAVAAYSTANRVATAFDATTRLRYPAAIDPAPLVGGFTYEADALALATRLLALHGPRRRQYRVAVGRWGHLVDPGDVVAVDYPRMSGNAWAVIGKSETGDAITLTLWG